MFPDARGRHYRDSSAESGPARIPSMRVAMLALALTAACRALLNEDFTREPAPPLDGGTWLTGRAPANDWRIVTFFDPESERSVANVPRLEALRREFGPQGVDVLAVTRAPVDDAQRFAKEHGAGYAIQALGAMAFERWGIGSAAHAPVYLVDPNNRVLTEGFDDCAEILRERLGAPAPPLP
jgi:hypothetical protein